MLYSFDDFELDSDDLELRQAGKALKVDTLVLRLLSMLVRNAGRLITKQELIDEVWDGRAIADNAITVSMARLRKALGESRKRRELIATVYGRGYRFVESVTVSARKRAAGPAMPRHEAHEPPFVGRERVLQRLRAALGEAGAARGRVCLLLGEPGIGKTRVVEQLEREARSTNIRVAWGYCREAGDTPPLWPWLRMLREITGKPWDGASAVVERERAPAEGSHRHQLFDEIVRALTAAAARTPWLFVLEDLHRADAASIELLSYLLDEIAHTRILVVATLRHSRSRMAVRPETHLPRVLGHRNSERVPLERLQPNEVSAYIAALVDDADGSLGRAVFAKSEGNPFFMTELARGLGNEASPSSASLEVPDTALELLRQHVAKLDVGTRHVLEAAAVIGRSFELPLLAMILDREPSDLMIAIDEAIVAGIVIAAPDSLTAFAFGHELQRGVLYEALAPREQRACHLQIADALEYRLRQGDPVPPSDLAYHSYSALPEGDVRKTVQHCRDAANAASRVFAIPDVLHYTRHALEALDLIPGASVRLRMSLLYQTSAYSRGHNWSETMRSTAELTRLAREQGDGPMLTRAATMLNVHPDLRPLPGANAAAEQALSLLPAHDLALRALALAQLACSSPRCYSRDASSPVIEDAAALAQHSGDRHALYPVLIWQLHLQGGPDYDYGAAIGSELDRLLLNGKREMPHMPVDLAMYRATQAFQRGDMAGAEAALQRAERIARAINHSELLWHIKRCHALCQVNNGALSEGLALLSQLHREAEQYAIYTAEPLCAFDRAVIFSQASGAPADIASLASELEHDEHDPPCLWALKIRALATAGLLDEALGALRRVEPGALAQLPCDSQYLGTLGHLTRAAVLLDARAYFEPLHALLARYPACFSAQQSLLCEGAVPSLLGRLLLALGRPAEALPQLQAGVAAERGAGLVRCATETQQMIDLVAVS